MSRDADHLAAHADDGECHLQTTGRVTGRPRTIEIWFAVDGTRIYLLAGGREHAHWVRNLQADPSVRVRIGGRTLDGRARTIEGDSAEPLAPTARGEVSRLARRRAAERVGSRIAAGGDRARQQAESGHGVEVMPAELTACVDAVASACGSD